WMALLKAMAEHASATLSSQTIEAAAEACRRDFVRRFFFTIKTDLEHKGGAFASIHLRMMSELVAVSRQNAAATAAIHEGQIDIDAKLEALMTLVSREG